jgi:hypothetical protein
VVKRALANDPARAKAEYLSQWRDDLAGYLDRAAIEACITSGVRERAPTGNTVYSAFCDPAGGSGSDAMTLAIGHRERDGTGVLDCIREARPHFSPQAVVDEFARCLKSYRIHKVTGDHWGGEFLREPFRLNGIAYQLADRPKSDLYRDALPLVNSGKVRLLDHPTLVTQLCQLERKVARSGKDSIDHPPGPFHDDVANAVMGLLVTATGGPPPFRISSGAMRRAMIPACPMGRLLHAQRHGH